MVSFAYPFRLSRWVSVLGNNGKVIPPQISYSLEIAKEANKMDELKILFILIFLGTSTPDLHAQTKNLLNFDHQITYTVTYLGDSTNMDSKRSEDMILLMNKNGSLFESRNSNNLDSIKYINNNKEVRVSKSTFSYFQYKVLKDYEKANMTTYDSTLPTRNEPSSKGIYYTEDLNAINWELSEDTATINNMVCQIAYTNFGNRRWKAYFNPDIPISDGPYKFYGLPGLIIRIVDNREHWDFQLKSIETSTADKYFIGTLTPVIDFQELKKDAFFKEKKFAEENFIQIQETMHGRNSDPEKRKRINDRMRDVLKLRSNWIEPYK